MKANETRKRDYRVGNTVVEKKHVTRKELESATTKVMAQYKDALEDLAKR